MALVLPSSGLVPGYIFSQDTVRSQFRYSVRDSYGRFLSGDQLSSVLNPSINQRSNGVVRNFLGPKQRSLSLVKTMHVAEYEFDVARFLSSRGYLGVNVIGMLLGGAQLDGLSDVNCLAVLRGSLRFSGDSSIEAVLFASQLVNDSDMRLDVATLHTEAAGINTTGVADVHMRLPFIWSIDHSKGPLIVGLYTVSDFYFTGYLRAGIDVESQVVLDPLETF